MNLQGMKVVVVGGAIGGASVALLLARAGAQVTLVERAQRARCAGAGIALADNGLAVLRALDVDVDVGEASSSLAGVKVVDARGRTLFAPRAHVRMMRRSVLASKLEDALACSSVEAHYGEELLQLDGRRVITRSTAMDADLVIGADGVHSRVRELAGFTARVRAGSAYVRGLAPPGLAQNVEAWTPAGLFGSFDVPGGTYWYASLGKMRSMVAARDLAGLRIAWARAYGPSAPLLEAVSSFDALLINDVLQVDCPRFVRGQVALVGDAAHAMAPNLGQGANSALVDAAVLCEALRGNATIDAALDAYDRRRRPRVQKVAHAAARLGKLAELTNPVARFLRDRVLMPLAARADDGSNTRMTLQEDPAHLALCASPQANAPSFTAW